MLHPSRRSMRFTRGAYIGFLKKEDTLTENAPASQASSGTNDQREQVAHRRHCIRIPQSLKTLGLDSQRLGFCSNTRFWPTFRLWGACFRTHPKCCGRDSSRG